MIPNIFHFVFGMAADFGGRPFSLSHYLAIKSAAEVNKPDAIFFHYEFEPTGEWWEKIKPLLTLNKVTAPESFMGQPLYHVAHKADVVRLQALKETGGIYLDLDTICVKPLHELLDHSFIIGQELKAEYIPKNWRQKIKFAIRKKLNAEGVDTVNGLCNAALLSEKDSVFVNLWLNTYSSFRSKGRDKYWNEHSVIVPIKLAKENPGAITLLGPYAFHYPLYDQPGLQSMFEKVTDFPGAYLHHLWESFSWDDHLSRLTVKDILETDTTYNCIARRFI
jgi:Glycosyltransferase sugar-binding region containing DXD motif